MIKPEGFDDTIQIRTFQRFPVRIFKRHVSSVDTFCYHCEIRIPAGIPCYHNKAAHGCACLECPRDLLASGIVIFVETSEQYSHIVQRLES